MRRFAPSSIRLFARLGLVVAIGFGGATSPVSAQTATAPSSPDDLAAIAASRDYFTLRERPEAVADETSPGIRLLQAKTLNAFNRPQASNEMLGLALERGNIDADLLIRIHMLRMQNHVRRHEYGSAAKAGRTALGLATSRPEPNDLDDLRNTLRLVEAIAEVPPQTRVAQEDSVLTIERGRIPVRIGDLDRNYVLDTGAGYSVLMQSEAKAIGLTILDANLDVGTSTDLKVTADVAVADTLTIGAIDFHHVVFLVFPDEVLTINEQVKLNGIIGFPVIEAMGELRYGPHGRLEIPATIPARTTGNLALDELVPLVRVGYKGHHLVARLDTGADRTQGYEPLYRRFRDQIEASGTPGKIRTGGVGSIRTLAAYTLPTFSITLADRVVDLRNIEVLTDPITSPEQNYLYLNIGRDALAGFDTYIINFRDMALVLE